MIIKKQKNIDLNIISNDCSALYMYRFILKTQYKNPFVGTYMDNKQFMCLLKNFNSINFNKVDFTFSKEPFFLNNLPYFKCNIDNIVDINYVHYNDIDSLYKLSKNYFKRLQRMTDNINIIIISDIGNSVINTSEVVKYVVETYKHPTKIIIMSYDDYSIYNSKDILFLERNDFAVTTLINAREKLLRFIYDN